MRTRNTRTLAGAAIATASLGAVLLGGAGAASASPWTDAIDNIKAESTYAYGPYTEDECHRVLMHNPVIWENRNNPNGVGACIGGATGAYYLYTDLRLH